MNENEKMIQEQQKTINDMKDALRTIGDYTEALKNVLSYLLADVPEGVLVMLTLNEIIKLAGQNA